MSIKVSIIMGIYNCEATLEESIDSIVNQTYKEWELIMCDDGSKDKSYEIAKKYVELHSNIQLLKNDQNRGLAYSLNRCIDMARGEYIARMDSDDISLECRLEKQINYLEERKDLAVLGSNAYYFDDEGVWGRSMVASKLNELDIVCGNIFIHPSVVIRKECIEQVGGYVSNELTYRAEDYDLWCRLYEKGNIGENIEQPLIKYRLDTNAYKKRKYKYRIEEYKLKKYWFNRFKLKGVKRIIIYKPLLVGLIPNLLMLKIHKRKFSLSSNRGES